MTHLPADWCRCWIDGAWHVPAGEPLTVWNPSTGEPLGHGAQASASQMQQAVAAARQRSNQGAWAPPQERARVLAGLAAAIRARRAPLATLEALNNGKPLPEALWDIDDVAACFEYYAELAAAQGTQQAERIPLPTDDFETHVVHEPVGVIGAIVPWNFPLLMAAWKVAPALAAGCTVVLKPSELTPCTALQLGELAAACGLPPGVLNILPGGPAVGAALAAHPDVDKVAFTGSLATGSRVMQAVAPRIANLTLELGGKSSLLVMDDADIVQAIEWALFGIFWNKGEVCSATSRLLVHQSLAVSFIERLAAEATRIRIGGALEPGAKLGPLVSQAQRAKVLAHVEAARAQGIRCVAGGHAIDRPGFFMAPTIYTDVPTTAPLWQEEVFGPVLAVRSFRTDDEAVALANDTRYGLAAAVMTRDHARGERLARRLRAGIVWINCSQPTFVQVPWGGMRSSGIGRELGRWGLEACLETKQVTRYRAGRPWGWFLDSAGDRTP